MNFSDPFGLCKEDADGNEDPECRKVIEILNRLAAIEGISDAARAALDGAIAGYEALKADVVFTRRPDRVAEGDLGGNSGEGPWGYIRLDIAVGNHVDFGLTAWHELQHRNGRTSREHRAIYREQAQIFRGLTPELQAQGVHTQRVLASWGVWP